MAIRISAISYLNSIPFLYALKQWKFTDNVEIVTDVPAQCAQKLLENKADVGLVPVAVIPSLPHAEIISDYCIGVEKQVRSVLLLSHKPLREIKTIRADNESRSSVALTKVLLKNYWKMEVKWVDNNNSEAVDAEVCIGDKAFVRIHQFPHHLDLAEDWYNYTGLPFVFACWVATRPLPQSFLEEFNAALRFGIEHKYEAALELGGNLLVNGDLMNYLEHNISFDFDAAKKEALQRFWEETKSI